MVLGLVFAVIEVGKEFNNIIVASNDEWVDERTGKEHSSPQSLRVFKTDTVSAQKLFDYLKSKGADKKPIEIPLESEEYQNRNGATRTRYFVPGKNGEERCNLSLLRSWQKDEIKSRIRPALFPAPVKSAPKNDADSIEFGF